jgi:hypothetical protein
VEARAKSLKNTATERRGYSAQISACAFGEMFLIRRFIFGAAQPPALLHHG